MSTTAPAPDPSSSPVPPSTLIPASGLPLVRLNGVRTVLMDIEGTICSISFVKEKMYPYSLSALDPELTKHFSSSASGSSSSPLTPYIAAFPESVRSSKDRLIAHIHDLVRRDVKDSALKRLQGYLWRSGFEAGELNAPLFEDVEPKWREWKRLGRPKGNTEEKERNEASGDAITTPVTSSSLALTPPPLQLAIYSSGSVEAQKMLLSHVGPTVPHGLATDKAPCEQKEPDSASERGGHTNKKLLPSHSLLPLFDAFFDTENTGPKTESGSYARIAALLHRKPCEILFLSDNPSEIRAAQEAQFQAVMVQRPGNNGLAERDQSELTVIYTFDQLVLNLSERGD